MSQIQIRNKKTGEVITLGPSPITKDEVKEEKDFIQETEARIKERPTIQESVRKTFKGEGLGQKATGALSVASAPFSALESAIANPALELQRGNVDPRNLVKQAVLGGTLQRRGEFGDVFKSAGVDPVLADTAGLVLMLSPIKIYSMVNKTFGNISKMSDKGLLKAGDKLVEATTEARDAIGAKVGQAYAKGADNVPANSSEFIDAVVDLPKPVLRKAELAFGNLEDFADGLTVGKLREFKRFIGKLKPSAFGQDLRGLQENIDVKDLNKVFSKVQKNMETSLRAKDVGIPKQEVDNLLNLDKSFSEIMDVTRFIRKTIVDPSLRKATKAGKLAEKVIAEGDATTRVALSTIKKASSKARRLINQAMEKINSFNKFKQRKAVASRVVGAAVFGGAAGAIGGQILRSVQDRGQQ